ncbi:hypothetical protein VTL71DRAFT_8940 [Oculimacula yallundae]|uniref:Uncharacterized protein n=1 Tax=Oculimacula yallundae TaxID=86028 RepID=A0ABR4BTE9_9HELO
MTTSATTPWSAILKAFIEQLPTNPWFPYANAKIAIFDETAEDGLMGKAYHQYGFKYDAGDTAGGYTVAVRVFTRKVQASGGQGRGFGGGGMGWKFEVGVHAQLIMRFGFGVEDLGKGEAEITTGFYPVVVRDLEAGKGNQRDPVWEEVVETLREVFVRDGVGEMEKEMREMQKVEMGDEVRVDQQHVEQQHVEPAIQTPNSKDKERVVAIPRSRQPNAQFQTPRTPSTPATMHHSQLTPSTTPTAAPSAYRTTRAKIPGPSPSPNTNRILPNPPSAETTAYYNAMRMQANTLTPINTRPNAHLFTTLPFPTLPKTPIPSPACRTPHNLTLTPAPTPIPATTQKRKASTPLSGERQKASASVSAETIAFYNTMRGPLSSAGAISVKNTCFESFKGEAEERRRDGAGMGF